MFLRSLLGDLSRACYWRPQKMVVIYLGGFWVFSFLFFLKILNLNFISIFVLMLRKKYLFFRFICAHSSGFNFFLGGGGGGSNFFFYKEGGRGAHLPSPPQKSFSLNWKIWRIIFFVWGIIFSNFWMFLFSLSSPNAPEKIKYFLKM